jgi:hypothetical protein
LTFIPRMHWSGTPLFMAKMTWGVKSFHKRADYDLSFSLGLIYFQKPS